MVQINGSIITWARETAGLSEAEAAHKLGIKVERLIAFEAGEAHPTRKQVANMAEKFRRPLIAFYRAAPPSKGDYGEDFRTLPESDRSDSEHLVSALVRNIYARQLMLKSALEDAEEDTPLSYIGSISINDPIAISVEKISATLGISRQNFRSERTAEAGFTYLRTRAEASGIFVLLIGNLGSHHTDIDVKQFRGFALADAVAPLVVINEKDTRSAWAFTLLHEIAHLFLGATGISGYLGEAKIERYCDQVAAEFLLSGAELNEISFVTELSLDEAKEAVGNFAAERNVSRGMIAYNLLRTGIISSSQYQELKDVFDSERKARDRRQKENSTRAPDYYVVRRHRLGTSLIGTIRRFVKDGTLSTTKAGAILGVKPTAVTRLVGSSAR